MVQSMKLTLWAKLNQNLSPEKSLPKVLSVFQKVGLGSLQTPKSEKPHYLCIASLKGTFLSKVFERILLLLATIALNLLDFTKTLGLLI